MPTVALMMIIVVAMVMMMMAADSSENYRSEKQSRAKIRKNLKEKKTETKKRQNIYISFDLSVEKSEANYGNNSLQ